MKFYHYATTTFDELRSKVASGSGSAEVDPWHYNKHISLFMEPIPRDLASILQHKHTFWRKGVVLIEHVIDSKDIPADIYYYLTETPEKTNLLYVTQDWSKVTQTNDLREQYIAEINTMETRKLYRGRGRNNLVMAARNFMSGIGKYYKQMLDLHIKHPEDKLMDKYAACVPHVMIYPNMAPIKVSEVNEIQLT